MYSLSRISKTAIFCLFTLFFIAENSMAFGLDGREDGRGEQATEQSLRQQRLNKKHNRLAAKLDQTESTKKRTKLQRKLRKTKQQKDKAKLLGGLSLGFSVASAVAFITAFLTTIIRIRFPLGSILMLAAFQFALVGLGTGIAGLIVAKKKGEKNGLAKAGFILALVMLGIFLTILLLSMVALLISVAM